jgi:transcription-repair coupling factor (superfamily II helicase)
MDEPLLSEATRRAIAAAGERSRESRLRLGGLAGSADALALAALAAESPLLAIVPDVPSAEVLADDVDSLAKGPRIVVLRPTLGAEDDAEGRADLSERIANLAALAAPRPGDLFLAPAAILLEPLPKRVDEEVARLELGVGNRIAPQSALEALREASFVATPLVAAPGEVSARGDILDVFPFGEEHPIRVEFFDDRIESIRVFDEETQLSIATRDRVVIALLRPDALRGKATRAVLLLDQLDPALLVARVDPRRCADRVEEQAYAHGVPETTRRRVRDQLAQDRGIDLVPESVSQDEGFDLGALTVQGLGGGLDGLRESIAALERRCDRIVVMCESEGEKARFLRILEERAVASRRAALELRVGPLRQGFQLAAERLAVLTELELLGKPRIVRPRPRKKFGSKPLRAVTNLLELHPGDHLVHQTHGVARFNGMVRMKRDQGEEDFLVLEFEGGTIFYLPASKVDLVQRFVGQGGTAPKLDKIGGKSWAAKKARVKAALEDLALELLQVQASRTARPGAPHARDDAMIAEFERAFAFADTPDQGSAMRDIHGDLDSRRPMDRLICGDVGFGKTEMAVRATFRAVLGGKQVAVLVPTTLLAEQHYETFSRRFASYPVTIAVLSRFRTRGELQQTLEKLKKGAVDIVIGTHRLLSKDVAFHDLGLIVVDEEQRFGVKAKEALKKLKASVDVLTLTATPIPRTLHMSLVGLRDISTLSTPPAGRRPVKTEVRRFDDAFVRRAILHELDRGGQVFLVHNRVRTLEATANRIAGIVPTARIVIGHGQMVEDELDEAIRTFARGDADVLVSTSIVESGLDLPRANTILIDHPEMFGLADLHQLRGRVGRSETQSYCYLLVKEESLPEDAKRRLEAITELSHLGAGHDIAIKDLEIRGAGNLLSAQQSGHISAVGYDLFCRLLADAVARAKGQRPAPPPAETDVDLGVDAFLPAEFVPDPGQRMEILRRIGAADAPPIEEFEAELRDRFGRIPRPVKNLLAVFALKRRCRDLGIRRLLHPQRNEVLLELIDRRRFLRFCPFEPREYAILVSGLVHVKLPDTVKSPQDALDHLVRRIGKSRAAEVPA